MARTARTDNDSWEITESVGATALGVAAARAAETQSEHPLIHDPFARVFLDAAGDGVWNWYSAPQLPAEVLQAEPEVHLRMQAMINYMACRTAFFDTFFLEATRSGIRQAVILAAGLDARCWRLPWPAGTTVYELDQPKVLEFKTSTLHKHGAEPTCNRVGVPVDLRQDWPKALRQAGFDASARAHGPPRGSCRTCRRLHRTCCSTAFRSSWSAVAGSLSRRWAPISWIPPSAPSGASEWTASGR
ncbi:putative S-adenosyl-L-methionine-dependent methyltransferase ML2640 [Mycobacterium kansasii]|uniref:S-adenosyl-L-methionine-dependent methyltransferase n=1 Tax=Mycobacterium kansasii TaxID=1768 RepID=A0A1V3WHG3_MYCKA|nr:putative S-adenosyl-L-methionine-dependent methyltransferase ML2640 [Mycobacterium kansasii]